MQRHSFTALNSTFVVDSEYEFVKELGQGAYGCVVAARHRRSGEGCAIKKITNINTKVSSWSVFTSFGLIHFDLKRILTKRCLREIRFVLVRLLGMKPTTNLHCKAVAPLPGSQKCLAIIFSGCDASLTYELSQITCLYDMDIVLQPNGNFDEVYLYVRTCPSSIAPFHRHHTGRTHGSRLARYREWRCT